MTRMNYKTLASLIFFLAVGINVNGQIRFDGLYETECDYEDDDEGEQNYLRFYQNGKVISVGTDCEGEASELLEWFTIEDKKGSLGEYYINGSNIKFTTTGSVGSVEYKGKISSTGSLQLKSKSLINGYKGKEDYKFVEITK